MRQYLDKSICYSLKILFSIFFVMGDFARRLLKNIEKIILHQYVLSFCARARERKQIVRWHPLNYVKFWFLELINILKYYIFKFSNFFVPLKDCPVAIPTSVLQIGTLFFTVIYSVDNFLKMLMYLIQSLKNYSYKFWFDTLKIQKNYLLPI